MKDKIKTNIQIEGAHLTPEAISRLIELQEHDNSHINIIRDYIANTICFIVKNMDSFSTSDAKEANQNITNLSFVRDYFNDLRKP